MAFECSIGMKEGVVIGEGRWNFAIELISDDDVV